MTHLFGVIGHPIAHSLSPAMHTAALRSLKVDGIYAPFEVPPRDLKNILRALTLAGVEGLNVTFPLKESVIPLLDKIDPRARAMRAVNTIVIKNRKLTGYNTDGVGFMQALRELKGSSRKLPQRALILGAGGSARAVTYELIKIKGIHLTIANRSPLRAKRLKTWLKRQKTNAYIDTTTLGKMTPEEYDLLVNATTVGMHPSDKSLIRASQLKRGMIVYDLVYHRQTPLVAAAQKRGCIAVNGLSMLLYQGAESLRLWLHRKPPIEAMRRALITAVKG